MQARHTPGGAGLVAARRLLQAKADGGTIALLSSNIIFGAALGLPGAEAASLRLVWVGGVAPDAWACVRTRSSITREAGKEAGRQKVWAGSLGVGSRADIHARAMRDLAGYPLQIASGYVSRFELVRAIETGEIDMACGWPVTDINRRRAEWIDSGTIELVARFSRMASGPVSLNEATAPEAAETLRALSLEADLAWPLAAPPDVSQDIARAFREALDKIAYDRSAIEDALRAGIALDPVPAETLGEHIERLSSLPDAVRKRLTSLFAPGGQ